MGRRFSTDLSGVRVLGTMNCEGCSAECPKIHGAQRWCLDCARDRKRAADRKYHAENAEANRSRVRAWQIANPDKHRATLKRFREQNRELIRQREARKYAKHGEHIREKASAWYAANRERVLAKARSEEGRKRSREKMRAKMKEPHFRMFHSVSRGIRQSIKDKHRRMWESLVGYSVGDLVAHLQRQFSKGMSWSNYGRGDGKWHIDHIVPRSAFTFQSADDLEFRACWALTNLRPMWGADNIRKHANRIHLL